MAFSAATFIAPYTGTDKRIILKATTGLTVGGFSACHYQKAMVEGVQMWINLADIKLVLEFATDADAKQALINLKIAIESLVQNCAIGGGGGTTYIHTQVIPSGIWTIIHNLGKYPSVTLVDTTSEVMLGDIIYINANTITVLFTSAIDGKAYLN